MEISELDRIFFDELKQTCGRIRHGRITAKEAQEVVAAYGRILDVADIRRYRGLPVLETEKNRWDCQSYPDMYLRDVIENVINGHRLNELYGLGLYSFTSYNLKPHEAFICLMYLKGSLMIQQGRDARRIQPYLSSIQPEEFGEAVEEYTETIWSTRNVALYNAENRRLIDLYTRDYGTVQSNSNGFSIIGQTASLIEHTSVNDLLRCIEELGNSDIAFMLKKQSPSVCLKVFNVLPFDVAGLIADDMYCAGQIIQSDSDSACIKFIKAYVSLMDSGEIRGDATDRNNAYIILRNF
mgnify:FL=1